MRSRKIIILIGFLITWSFVTYYFLLRSTNNSADNASENTKLNKFNSNYNNNKINVMKHKMPPIQQQTVNAQNELKQLEAEIMKEQSRSRTLTNNVIRLLDIKYHLKRTKDKEIQFMPMLSVGVVQQAQPNAIQEPPAEELMLTDREAVQVEAEPQKLRESTTVQTKLLIDTHLANGEPVIPILIFSCNRVTVAKCINNLLMYRKSKEQFPIIVSQDCGDEATKKVILSYKDDITLIEQPDQSDIAVPPREKKFKGYYKIARHYGWALNTTFQRGYEFVVIVEDDLNVAPDFFEYFHATYKLLKNDSSLWCISAWNDNGKDNFIDTTHPELLYRTDFFPGLGWMLSRELWQELSVKWPKSFWDDWIRHPNQRKDRVCIRPEISRTKTFGKIGVSNGLFFDKYLKHIKLSDEFVPFTKLNLSYLIKENYDNIFLKEIYSLPVVTFEELRRNLITTDGPVRIQYSTRDQYKGITKMLGLMDDLKSGVPRTAYHGVVSFFYKNRRVHLAPNLNWKGYDITWS